MEDKLKSSDKHERRKRARVHIENGAVTESYQGDPQTSVRLLNDDIDTTIHRNLHSRNGNEVIGAF